MPRSTTRRILAATTVAGALAAAPALALGHAELVSSDPEAGANVDTAPIVVTLTFDGELDPDGSGFMVTDHRGDEVGSGALDLDVVDRNIVSGPVTIDEPGVYTVEWSVLGADGHEISGSFSFGYATDEAIPESHQGGHDHENPDTALPTSGSSPLTAAGLVLVLLAGVLAVRRAAVR